MKYWLVCLAIGLGLALPAPSAAQVKFYQYYDKGLNYLQNGDYLRALEQFQSAASLEFEDKKRKRTYGTHFIRYYPHLQIGKIYFHLGEIENARRELELSVAYSKSKEAKGILKKIASGLVPAPERTAPVIGSESRPTAEHAALARRQAVADSLAQARRLAEGKRRQAVADSLAQVRRQAELRKMAEEKRQRSLADSLARLQQAQAEEGRRAEDLRRQPSRSEVVAPPISLLPLGALTYDPNKVTRVGERLGLAVLPFQQTGGDLDLSERLESKLITQLVNLRRFNVLERSALAKIMEEQALGMSGVVDEQKAVRAGKLAGVDAIVLGGVRITPGLCKVSARVIDTETSVTIVARESQTNQLDPLHIEQEVGRLAIMIYNDLPLVEGTVIQVEGDEVFLDLGTSYGIRRGTKCVAYREGEPILHPTTGEVLGKRVTPLSELVVVQEQAKLSIAKIVKQAGGGSIAVGDKFVVK